MDLTYKQELARQKVCLALDGLNTLDDIRSRVQELSPVVGLFKIGNESYTRFGNKVIEIIHKTGSKVFLDLKYHDIPNTIKGAAEAATQLGVYMFNVHASGGVEMMEAAVQGANETSVKYGVEVPKIIGVTVLTSINQAILNRDMGVQGSVENQVLHLARKSQKAGLDGIVCSASDINFFKENLPSNFMYVTPGIKGPNTIVGEDQKRVVTAGQAIQYGSDILVVGRAITGYSKIEERLNAGLNILDDMGKYI